MLQALFSIALVALFASALLASALASAKIAQQQAARAAVAAGLVRGTEAFVAWGRRTVGARGAAELAAASGAAGTVTVADEPSPVCLSAAADAASQPVAGAGPCAETVTVSFAVTGGTGAAPAGAGASATAAVARNLQSAVNENRVAGTVTAVVRDRNGNVAGTGARSATIRVFDAAPFAVLAGVRDATTMAAGAATAGDTAGVAGPAGPGAPATPDAARPAADVETTIRVTMACENSAANADAADPYADDHAPGNDGKLWGVSGGTAFEAPCDPAYALRASPAIPAGSGSHTGDVYDVGSFADERWSTGAPPASSWAP